MGNEDYQIFFLEQAIRTSKSLDDNVFDLLDKMENFQEKRNLRWENRMEKLASEREEIAKLLVKTLEMIEHETGIFLIKPIMSVPSRYVWLIPTCSFDL